MNRTEYLQQFIDETSWFNNIVLGGILPEAIWRPLPSPLQSWLRNYISGIIVYLICGFLWSFYIYHLKRNVHVPKDAVPSYRAMKLQIIVSMKAMPWYCALPTVSEYMVENGWTKCISKISEIGWPLYIFYLVTYLILCEFGIYWMHRELHDVKPLYKLLHATHHIYNKQNTLSPFAGLDELGGVAMFSDDMRFLAAFFGLAFHPLDGILQAFPHVVCLFIVPTHFMTHMLLLFLEGIWTTNIHDCIHGKVWPIMGAGYHTIHHTTYRHNYGHYTIWMDWLFGTLCDPEKDSEKQE